ncbi:MAG: DUF484 family protein [Gammaproteobacteria bacterium]|nr:DUF484 family protein [Gammaproteobacteria bacterium]
MPAVNAEDLAATELDEIQVAAYLRQHPDLLSRYPELLETLELAHDSGSAVSLIERQVELLRGKNNRLEVRLGRLLEHARENERRALALQKLARTLLRAPSLAAVVAALKTVMRENFAVDEVFVGLLVPGFRRHDIDGLTPLESGGAILRTFENFFRTRLTECGPLTAMHAALLFPRAATPPQSAAIVALEKERPLGMLALGAKDPQRFQPRQGKLFVEMTAELAAAALRARLS